MYGGAGTGRWDIYGHGANLRISDNDNAGSFVVDRNTDLNGGLDVTGTFTVTGTTTLTVSDADFIVADSTDSPSNFIWRDHSDSKLYLGSGAAVVTPRSSVIPQADSTYNLGTSSVRWANVYADTLYGDGSNLTNITATADLVTDLSLIHI